MSNLYHPLNTIISIEGLPTELNFLEQGIETIFDNLYFRDLSINEDLSGLNINYQLIIATDFEIALLLPGTGFKLKLFPPTSAATVSEFPINVYLHKGILKYISDFRLSSFSFDGTAFFDIAKKIISADEVQLTVSGIETFVTVQNNKVQQFFLDVNTNFGYNLVYDLALTEEENINLFITYATKTQFNSIWEVIFGTYFTGSISDIFVKTNKFLSVLLTGDDSTLNNANTPIELIKKVLIPELKATLELSAALEFPRSILQPINVNNVIEPDNTKLFNLYFEVGEFIFNTNGSFGFSKNLIVTFPIDYPKAQIGNTQLTIAFDFAKLDLSKTNNIAEADADRRPNDFIGVYIEEATIGFPAFWNADSANSTAQIVGKNLLIGTGGISGVLSLETATNGKALFKLGNTASADKHFELGLNAFLIEFKQNAIVRSAISGTLKIPGFKDPNGNLAEINVTAFIGTNGDFLISASEKDGLLHLAIPEVLKLELRQVAVDRLDNRWFLEASAKLTFIAEIPKGSGNKLLEDPIDIRKIRIYEDGSMEINKIYTIKEFHQIAA